MKQHPLMVFTGVFCVCILFFVQLLYWRTQTGEWLIWSYGNEKFDFTSPHMLRLFFGFRKGLFVYTPLTLLSLIGLFTFLKRNKLMFFNALFFILFSGFVLSSWWSWWYGMSFGMRAYIDFFPFFFLLFAFGLQSLPQRITKVIFAALALMLVYVNQVQAYQYTHYILHWENMDRSKYFSIFLKTEKRYEGALWETDTTLVIGKTKVAQFSYNFETTDNRWLGGAIKNSPDNNAASNHVGWLNKDIQYSQTLVFSLERITQDSELIVKLSLRYYRPNENVNGCLVISSENQGKASFYKAYNLPDVLGEGATHQWSNFSAALKIDKVMKGTQLKVYVYNPEKQEFYIDDIEVKLFQP